MLRCFQEMNILTVVGIVYTSGGQHHPISDFLQADYRNGFATPRWRYKGRRSKPGVGAAGVGVAEVVGNLDVVQPFPWNRAGIGTVTVVTTATNTQLHP